MLEKRLDLIKVYKIIYAEHFKFMWPYILLNNEKRMKFSINKDKIGVEPSKLINNSVFGKQSENMINIWIEDLQIMKMKLAKKLAGNVKFKDFHILTENVTLYDMKKANILLDKTILI